MRRSHMWSMIEGIFCGVLQVLAVEFGASVYYQTYPFWRIVVPLLAVVLSTTSFYLLMRRYPAVKAGKFGYNVFAFVVILPAWFVYRSVFQWQIFPRYEVAEAASKGAMKLLAVFIIGYIITRAVIITLFYIRKVKKKKQKQN